MAKQLTKLVKPGVSAKNIAALLQSKGRYGDTILAHITPKEAALLKKRGGSGTINPDTGLPEFYNSDDMPDEGQSIPTDFGDEPQQQAAADTAQTYPVQDTSGSDAYQYQDTYGGYPFEQAAQPAMDQTQAETARLGAAPYQPEMQAYAGGVTPTGEYAAEEARLARQEAAIPTEVPKQKGLQELLGSSTLQKLGLAGLQTIPAALMGRKAAQQAAQTKAEQQQIASPYQQMGRQLQAQTQAGQLTPVSQQALEAARAQSAQQVQQRGGVGAMQAQMSMERFRQQLLQNQMDYALKLTNIGDQIALGAIKSGMQSDQYVSGLTSNFMNNLFKNVLQPTQPETTQGTPQ
ncbi:MAG: hypothetical protein EBR82_11985 [Caulobacteraceae bacterium]|nr:hypothetical protein [Caulobacteraceae bacterium]